MTFNRLLLLGAAGCGGICLVAWVCFIGLVALGVFTDTDDDIRSEGSGNAVRISSLFTSTPTDQPQSTDTAAPPSATAPTETPSTRIISTPADTPSSTPPAAPERRQSKPTSTPRLTIIENVSIAGGIEVYPAPSRSSGRIFAAVSAFQPHVAGRSQDDEWLYILYFSGSLQSGWAPRHELSITDAQVAQLNIIDPDNPPSLPDLPYNEAASRPYGQAANTNDAGAGETQPPTSTTLPGQPTSTTAPTVPAPPTRTPYPAVAGSSQSCQDGSFDFAICRSFQRPANCADAIAKGIPDRAAACCFPALDGDKDGLACYGT